MAVFCHSERSNAVESPCCPPQALEYYKYERSRPFTTAGAMQDFVEHSLDCATAFTPPSAGNDTLDNIQKGAATFVAAPL